MAGFASTFRHRNRTPFRARGRGAGQWNPAYLSTLRYWLDRSAITDGMTEWVPSVDTEGAGNSTFGAGSNSPLALGYNGTAAVYFPGAAGNYISTADKAALDITGDIEIVFCFAANDWSPATTQTIAAKEQSGAQRSWRLDLRGPTGPLVLTLSADGSATTAAQSSAVVGWTDGTFNWGKVTWRASDGRTQFFTVASDQVDEPTFSTQLGTDITAAVGSIFSSTSIVEIGSRFAGAVEPFAGKVRRLIVRNGIGGSTVADFNAASCTQTGHTDAYGNVWTLNYATSGRKLVIQSPAANTANGIVLLGTDDRIILPSGARPDRTASASSTQIVVARWQATEPSFARIMSDRNGASAGVETLFHTANNVYSLANDATNNAVTAQLAPTVGTRVVISTVLTPTTLTTYANNTATATASTAAVGDRTGPGLISVGSSPVPGSFADVQIEAVLLLDDDATATEIAQIVAYYGGGL